MYGNTYIEKTKDPKNILEGEDSEKLAEFEARIQRGEKIEPMDWMPHEYRRQLIRMIEQHGILKSSAHCLKAHGLPAHRDSGASWH